LNDAFQKAVLGVIKYNCDPSMPSAEVIPVSEKNDTLYIPVTCLFDWGEVDIVEFYPAPVKGILRMRQKLSE